MMKQIYMTLKSPLEKQVNNMVKTKKKVILLIVEGESDEILLIDRLRELFGQHEIRFEAQRGDILYHSRSRNKPIKEIIGEAVKLIMQKRKYRPEDILAITQIIDTDGVLIPDDAVVINREQIESTRYNLSDITVCDDKQRKNIIERNKMRSRNILTMNSVDAIIKNKYSYQMYYFSRNLEHVVFNEPNPNHETKVDHIETFTESLEVPLEDFLIKMSYPTDVESYREKYQFSWQIMNGSLQSLQRATNVPLMFDFIEMKTSEISTRQEI